MARAVNEGAVTLDGLCKRYGDVDAVVNLSLDVPGGQFFSLLGPSGCGKTTTLRMLAGFEEPTSGRILIGGADMTRTPAHKRPVNTVFQNYALFTHLTVKDNVGFGLRFTRATKAEKERKIADALALVQLGDLGRRRPHELSGGQQQRVALARALVLEPAVLLLDEPLGALDAKLRRELQIELKALQETVGITFLYVTHDQEEALTMSDHLAVMRDGVVQQIGSPRGVYEEPATAYVASFLGVSNLMAATAEGGGRVRLGETPLRAERGARDATGPVQLTIRPERVGIEPAETTGENRVPATIERFVYLGSTTQVFIRLASGDPVQALVTNAGDVEDHDVGSRVAAHLAPDGLRVLPGEVGES
jgi:spermidine/putrescine transport system ATP-binding protein